MSGEQDSLSDLSPRAGDESLEVRRRKFFQDLKAAKPTLRDVFTIVIGTLFFATLAFYFPRAFKAFRELTEPWIVTAVCVLGVLFAGIALFIWRMYFRISYSYLEIVVALIIAGFASRQVTGSGGFEPYLKMAAAAYFVVRGLANLAEAGSAKRPANDAPSSVKPPPSAT